MTDINWGDPISAKMMRSLDLSADTPVLFCGYGDGPTDGTYSTWSYRNSKHKYKLPADHEYYQRYGNMDKLIQAVRDGDIDEARKHLPVDEITLKARQICADVMCNTIFIDGSADWTGSMQVAIAALKEAGYEHSD